jgi:hypothetical protein
MKLLVSIVFMLVSAFTPVQALNSPKYSKFVKVGGDLYVCKVTQFDKFDEDVTKMIDINELVYLIIDDKASICMQHPILDPTQSLSDFEVPRGRTIKEYSDL